MARRNLMPGDLVMNDRGYGLVVAVERAEAVTEEGEYVQFHWHIVINDRLVRTAMASSFKLVQLDT